MSENLNSDVEMSIVEQGTSASQPVPLDLEAGENQILLGLNQPFDSVQCYIYGTIFCAGCLFICYILLILQIFRIL